MRSILVIGAGRFGENLAVKLTELNNEVMVVDRNEDIINKIAPYVTMAQVADCMNKAVLETLGVRNFDICFVCISDNFQSSMEITSLLKELEAQYIVSKSDGALHAELLSKIGADEVVYPERDMAWRTAAKFSAKGAFDYIELSPEYAIFEVVVPKCWIGFNLRDLDVRMKYHLNVIGVRKEGKVFPFTNSEHIFTEKERIILAGSQKDIYQLLNKNG